MFNPKSGMLGMFMLPLSIVWVGVVLYALGYLISTFIFWIISSSNILRDIGFDWDLFISALKKSYYFQPTLITRYSVIFLAVGIFVIYLGLKMSKEKADLYQKYPSYIAYMIFYSILMGVFWIFALSYLFIRKKGSVMW
jgi:hypothetical protein